MLLQLIIMEYVAQNQNYNPVLRSQYSLQDGGARRRRPSRKKSYFVPRKIADPYTAFFYLIRLVTTHVFVIILVWNRPSVHIVLCVCALRTLER